MEGAIEPRFCDQQGNCRGVLPGTKGIHNFLHDNVAAYRAWHHSPLRVPTHTLITLLALAFASFTVFQLTKEQPAQAATGIFAEFPFQGRLTNSDGTVVANANYDAVFQLYTVSTGGSAVWTESHTGGNQLSTTDGIFNTLLGSISSLSGIDFNQDEYWLGITVGADAEMTPRIRLGAAPYSFNSDKLNGLSSTAFLQLNGQAGGQTAFGGTAASENLVLRSTSNATKGNVIIADDGGLVGVGVADPFQTILGSVSETPSSGIHIDGGSGVANITLEGNDPGFNMVNNTGGANAKWTEMFQSTGGYLAFYSRNDAGILVQTITAPILSLNNITGNIGIGTNTTPDFKLEVAGSVGPNADNTYDLGSSSLRWRDLFLGPTSLHLKTTVAETATARDWKLTVDETNGATDGDLRIQEGSNSYFGVTTAGNVVLGSAALATSATNGFLYTPSMAGVPTGVPTSYTGRTPLAYNTASNILYLYNGGWQAINGGSGITGSGTAGRVTVWSGATAVTSDAEYLYDSTNNLLSIGANPSIDTASVINIPNNKAISARNAANTANFDLLRLTASNQIGLGYTSSGIVALDLYGGGPEALLINNTWSGPVANMSLEGALSVYNQDGLPANVAISGAIRVANGASLTARNSTNTGDISLISLDSNNQISFGYTSSGLTAFNLYGGATETLLVNNTWAGPVANLSVEGALSVYNQDGTPANIANSGAIRLGSNASITARNAANTSDISLISLEPISNQIAFGYTSSGVTAFNLYGGATETLLVNNTWAGPVANLSVEGALSVYNADGMAGSVATSGAVRLKNNDSITARNFGNTADISLISLDANNQIAFGYTSTGVTAFNLYGGATETLLVNNTWPGTVANLSVEGALLVYNQDGTPANIANTGAIRMSNNASIMARNATNTADISLIKLNSSDLIEFAAGLNLSGSLIPSVDDTYNLGSSTFRWQDLYLGPTSLHLATTAAETGTARDWKMNVMETVGATRGDLRIQDGSNTYFAISASGNIVLNSGALAAGATDGFLYMASMVGTPTGAPTSYAGRNPITYNSTNNALYAYNGGAWQQLTSMSGGTVTLDEVSTPSAVANKGKLYVKDIGGGNNSIFFQDENGTETDLVNDKLGTSEKLRTIRGNVNADGTIAQGTGFTVVKNSTGYYTITYSTAFSALPTITFSSPWTSGSAFVQYFVPTTSGFNVDTTSDSSGGTLIDRDFSFIIMGTP